MQANEPLLSLLHPLPSSPPWACWGAGYLLQLLAFVGHGEQHSAVAHHRDLLPEGAAGGHGEALQVGLRGHQGPAGLPGGGWPGRLRQAVPTLLALNLLIQNHIAVLLVEQLSYRGEAARDRERIRETGELRHRDTPKSPSSFWLSWELSPCRQHLPAADSQEPRAGLGHSTHEGLGFCFQGLTRVDKL